MLNRYSERGDAYVESLKTIMRVNRLDAADDAYLGDGPEIELIPVDSYSSSAACLESERLKAPQAPADFSC